MKNQKLYDKTLTEKCTLGKKETTTTAQTTLSKDNPSAATWDDEDFEMPDPDLSKAVSREPVDPTCPFEEQNEQWLVPLSLQAATEQPASLSSSSPQDLYLTKQFKNLNTPASRKKNRCCHCTRPTEEGNPTNVCYKCHAPTK